MKTLEGPLEKASHLGTWPAETPNLARPHLTIAVHRSLSAEASGLDEPRRLDSGPDVRALGTILGVLQMPKGDSPHRQVEVYAVKEGT
jgi:hypothetical protein